MAIQGLSRGHLSPSLKAFAIEEYYYYSHGNYPLSTKSAVWLRELSIVVKFYIVMNSAL